MGERDTEYYDSEYRRTTDKLYAAVRREAYFLSVIGTLARERRLPRIAVIAARA